MTMDPDGKPRIREFGNIKPGTRKGRPRIDFKEQREPLIDVLETEDAVRIVAEVPGVEKQDINLRGSNTALMISVDTAHRKYYKEVDLPAQIDPKRAKSTYKNGILEVTLPKKAKEKPTGERISIE
jgi:HSP20 family protein